MKHTAFYHIHKSYNARMVPFAGFEMPVEYEGVTKEHIAVRERVGVFDVSHMGEFWVKGPQAKALLQKVTTNDLNKIHNGKAQYTCFPNGKGGIVDDLIIYQFEEEKFMVVVNAANIEKDFNWLKKNNSNDVELENASDKISQLAIQGPKAMDVVQKITDVDLKAIPFFGFVTGRVAGIDEVIISATGYTGSGGVELYFDNKHAEPLWNALFDAGKAYDIVPVGLAARDTLRLEAGFCLYGNDIDDSTSPLEAGLGWITRFVDGNDFIDREYLSRQKEQGVQKKLVGFELLGRGIPRQHYEIQNEINEPVGIVTSGTMSPMLKKGIGMGYVESRFSAPGTIINIAIRNKKVKAKVVKPPFFKG